ncbi:MAG: adenosine deaminase, partial [Endozoicomonadaceae bacterium]|nr:adenosine deaminase [Endozoicomonadaceae bacterium]
VNSDDPAYFGGYINENYFAVAKALSLDKATLVQLAHNSFTASLLDAETKAARIKEVNAVAEIK